MSRLRPHTCCRSGRTRRIGRPRISIRRDCRLSAGSVANPRDALRLDQRRRLLLEVSQETRRTPVSVARHRVGGLGHEHDIPACPARSRGRSLGRSATHPQRPTLTRVVVPRLVSRTTRSASAHRICCRLGPVEERRRLNSTVPLVRADGWRKTDARIWLVTRTIDADREIVQRPVSA